MRKTKERNVMKKVKGAKTLNNKGFSMVELIIVIAIIAILATVLAPQYFKHLENARETTDLDAYRNIVSALQVELINSDVESGTIEFEDGAVKDDTTSDDVETLLSGVGIDLDNVKMKSDAYSDVKIEFATNDGVVSFSVNNKELATALGIKETTPTT